MSQLDELRREKDEFFRNSHHSPLTPEQQREFKGLSYFPENLELRLELPVERFEEQEQIQLQTTTGDIQTYTRYGRIHFEVDGEPAELTLYESEHGYFLPFVDALAPEETYPAGRYLDPPRLADGRFEIDFNQAYNPYCAYNEHWSCPLTPFENRLKVPIRAGEKNFKGTVVK